MINKLIIAKIREILTVITLVIISIPIWQSFDEKVSAASITSLDEYNLNFNVYKYQDYDKIIIRNEYNINKNYRLYLLVNQKLDNNTIININNITYHPQDFFQTIKSGKYIYTLIENNIGASQTIYNINIDSKLGYSYIFEENSNF